MEYITVIGLEVHVQLNTKSKMFCADKNLFGVSANSNVSAISLAHPGTLPMVNQEAIDSGIKLGLALDASVPSECRFDRKHYFYPDSPKAYQITQDQMPICVGGEMIFDIDGSPKKIRFHHAHLEEDAGKLLHPTDKGYSAVDLNRAGVPLIEIVTEPDFRSGKEVFEFLKKLQQLVRYIGISDANMEEGSMRCDCNVSVMTKGAQEFGTRCEVKNVNSKRFAQKAIEYEAQRQIKKIESGGTIIQQTRHFDAVNFTTFGSRNKEDAHDYRYFPDPDIPPVLISQERIARIKSEMPLLPAAAKASLIEIYKLSEYQAEQLTAELEFYQNFIDYAQAKSDNTLIANIFINKIIPYTQEHNLGFEPITAKRNDIKTFHDLIKSGQVNASSAMQALFPVMMDDNTSKTVKAHAQELGLLIESKGDDEVKTLIQSVLDNHPAELKKYQSGKKALFGFFMGQVMKASSGLDAKQLKKTLGELLNG